MNLNKLALEKLLTSTLKILSHLGDSRPSSLDLEGALSQGFCCLQVNSVLKSLLSTFTHTQTAPAELRRRHQMEFSREGKP